MNSRFRMLLAAVYLLATGACATAYKINTISVGMTKAEVIEKLGEPVSVSAQNGWEYLNYKYAETGDDAFYGRTMPYYVRIINGRVESYGRTGDFDSTKTPTVRVETDNKVRVEKVKEEKRSLANEDVEELVKLKKLKDAGVITNKEFEKKKHAILGD